MNTHITDTNPQACLLHKLKSRILKNKDTIMEVVYSNTDILL